MLKNFKGVYIGSPYAGMAMFTPDENTNIHLAIQSDLLLLKQKEALSGKEGQRCSFTYEENYRLNDCIYIKNIDDLSFTE